MSDFKWKHFQGEIILGCVRWYCKYGIRSWQTETPDQTYFGLKSMKTAYATIKGFEVMRMFKKGQFNIWIGDLGLTGEIWLIERQFGIYSAP